MSDTEVAPSTGPLTIEQAVSSVLGAEPAVETPEGEETASLAEELVTEELPAEPEAGDDATPAEEPVSGEEEGELEPAEERPVIEAPPNWDAEAKVHFEKLPAELQTYLSQREADRDKAVSTAQREAADTRKVAEGHIQQVKTLGEQLAEFLPVAVNTFKSRWGDNPDWLAVAKEHGTDQADEWRAQHDTEKAQLTRLATEQATATKIARDAYIRDEGEKFVELVPGITDEAKKGLGSYLVSVGLKPEDVNEAGAVALSLGWKAWQWDQHQAAQKAKLASLKTPAPRPAPVLKPQVRPAGAQTSTSQARNAQTLDRRLSQTGSVDDAVALLMSRKTG